MPRFRFELPCGRVYDIISVLAENKFVAYTGSLVNEINDISIDIKDRKIFERDIFQLYYFSPTCIHSIIPPARVIKMKDGSTNYMIDKVHGGPRIWCAYDSESRTGLADGEFVLPPSFGFEDGSTLRADDYMQSIFSLLRKRVRLLLRETRGGLRGQDINSLFSTPCPWTRLPSPKP